MFRRKSLAALFASCAMALSGCTVSLRQTTTPDKGRYGVVLEDGTTYEVRQKCFHTHRPKMEIGIELCLEKPTMGRLKISF